MRDTVLKMIEMRFIFRVGKFRVRGLRDVSSMHDQSSPRDWWRIFRLGKSSKGTTLTQIVKSLGNLDDI